MIKTILLITLPILIFAYSYEEQEMMKDGKELYFQTCVSCHGKDGETDPKMKLIISPRKLSKTILTAKQSYLIIKEGAHFYGAHADIMPAFKYVYDEDQMEALTFFISESFNPSIDKKVKKLLDESKVITFSDTKKMLRTGEKIFKQSCSMCHGKNGNGQSPYVEKSKKGDSFIFPYNLTRTLLDENQIFLYAKYGGKYWGTVKDDMPSWKKKYSDIELKSVAKYINLKIKKID